MQHFISLVIFRSKVDAILRISATVIHIYNKSVNSNVCHMYLLMQCHLIGNIERALKNRVHVHTFHKGGNAWHPQFPPQQIRIVAAAILFNDIFHRPSRPRRCQKRKKRWKRLVPSSDIVCKGGGDARRDEYKCLRRVKERCCKKKRERTQADRTIQI